MKNIKVRSNCYVTASVVADLVFTLIKVFDNDNKDEKLLGIYKESYINTIKSKYMYLGEIIKSLHSQGYEMLEFLLINDSFNDIEEYKRAIYSMKDVEFFYFFYGQFVDKASLELALQDDMGLNKLYSQYGYISTSYLALKSLFSNKQLFLEEFFACIEELYTEDFIKAYKTNGDKVKEETLKLEKALMLTEPLEFSQSIMGKIFKNRGPYESFIFVPSYYINKKAVRFFHKNQILIYSPSYEEFSKSDITKILKVISDDTRYEILELLSKNTSMIGKDLANSLKVSTPTISHHIEQLKDIGFINEERVKNSKFYSINSNSIAKFISHLSDRFKDK